jgi:hypothetical protein
MHTPKPWTVGKHGEIIGSTGELVVSSSGCIQPPNAILIAAAPELLKALKEARDLLACARITEDDPYGEEMAAYLTMIDGVIAKAEGRSCRISKDREGQT